MVWGTTYHVKYRSDRDLSGEIAGAMRLVDSVFSAFNPASEVSRAGRGDSVRVGREFAEVLELSRRVHGLSRGAFDPTVAPLVELWGFGPGEGMPQPTDEAIDSALALVGLERCAIGPDGVYSGPRLDFGAIAKGYGVDCVARALRAAGCEDYMVEIGGEVAARGCNPRGEAWRIQVDAPTSTGTSHDRLTVVTLADECIATSGNYRNRRTLPDGSAAWHTISPVTGRPVVSEMLSATVRAATCAEADALATAAMAMPTDSALRMLEGLPGVWALLVMADGEGYRTVEIGARE